MSSPESAIDYWTPSTMKRFHGTNSSWLLRQAEYKGENTVKQAVWEMDAITSGKELVLRPFEVVSPFQVLPPKAAPICFERAVLGLGSQCGLSYCAENTPTAVYKAYRDQVQEYYMATPQQWATFTAKTSKQYDTSTGFSPMKCIEATRYYNFQSPHSGLEVSGEPLSRQGERYPDSADNDGRNGPSNSRPVVVIIERRGTRAVLNLEKLIEKVVSAGFRLKVTTYDFGCGIPQTAYLMRDVQILISPHGNALGGSLWMPDKPFPVLISIDTTMYQETWFMSTTTVLEQRFIIHRCGPKTESGVGSEDTCPLYRDLEWAHKVLQKIGWVLDTPTDPGRVTEDLMTLTNPEYPIEMFDKYGGEKLHMFLAAYWKNLSRYVDVDRLMRLLEQIRNDMQKQDSTRSFLDICRDGRCCGPGCEGVMARNLVGPLRAHGQQMDPLQWGEYASDEGSDPSEVFKSWAI
ncbi:hypothetical protein BGZ94_002296 [Podila epigama]|nr:hypothetical protein BGZ94_002296 [Podila epigama]